MMIHNEFNDIVYKFRAHLSKYIYLGHSLLHLSSCIQWVICFHVKEDNAEQKAFFHYFLQMKDLTLSYVDNRKEHHTTRGPFGGSPIRKNVN